MVCMLGMLRVLLAPAISRHGLLLLSAHHALMLLLRVGLRVRGHIRFTTEGSLRRSGG